MTKKRDRQLAKERQARQLRRQAQVRCDECGTLQPLRRGDGSRHANGELDIAGCLHCGHHYGTWVQ